MSNGDNTPQFLTIFFLTIKFVIMSNQSISNRQFDSNLSGLNKLQSVKSYKVVHDKCAILDKGTFQRKSDVTAAKIRIVPLIKKFHAENAKDSLSNIVESIHFPNDKEPTSFELKKVNDFMAYCLNVKVSQAKQYNKAAECVVSGIAVVEDIAKDMDNFYRNFKIEPVKDKNGKNAKDSSGLRLVQPKEEKPANELTVTEQVKALEQERTKALQSIERSKKSIAEKKARVSAINAEIQQLQS